MASGRPSAASSRALDRIVDLLDRPVPFGPWLALLLGASLVWLLPVLIGGVSTFALDWRIYGDGRELWLTTGSPYAVPPPGWDPDTLFPYLYPPTSWPLLLLTYLPWPVVLVGLVPIALRPPRLVFAIPAIVLFAVSVGPSVFYGNVNVLVAGLIVLAFRPGATGGLAVAAAAAVKAYPLALAPLLWVDRRRILWAAGGLVLLAVTGTIAFGPGSWGDFIATLIREGPYTKGALFNPLVALGSSRIVAAGAIAVTGVALGSPTLTLLGATWLSAGTTIHYLLTFAAALCVEPPVRGRDVPVRSLAARLRRGPAAAQPH